MDRLPKTRKSTDNGVVYVVKRGDAYKIGFSRSLARRLRDLRGELVCTIPVGQRPAQLEYLLNNRFALKRLPSHGRRPGDKREWFALDADDIEWLQGFALMMCATANLF